MELIQAYITDNPYYIHPTIRPTKGMLHSVGCAQPDAGVFIRAWNRSDYYASSVHAVIDANTGRVYQCLPWTTRGEHCGGAYNDCAIGVEMCESSAIRYTGGSDFQVIDPVLAAKQATTAYNAAVELFAELARRFGWNPATDIVSHREAGMIGMASGHVDPEHYWQQLGLPYTMNGFRGDVAARLFGGGRPAEPVAKEVDVLYRVKTQRHGWLPEVRSLTDYAGWQESPICGVAIRAQGVKLSYAVRTVGGVWLPWVEGYNITDYDHGYAGDGHSAIDAIKLQAGNAILTYRVQAQGNTSYYTWQRGVETGDGMDGYAGLYGHPITRLQIQPAVLL